MTGTRAAIRYAKAVLALAREQHTAEEVHTDMKNILHTVQQSKDLQLLLKSPVVKAETKKAALKEIFAGSTSLTKEVIDTLAANKRLELLRAVAGKYIMLYDKAKGKETAVVTTAIPLTPELEKKVRARIKELTPHEVTIKNKIDESIIGGFILRIGDLQYNASIAHKLNELKRVFHTNFEVSTMN